MPTPKEDLVRLENAVKFSWQLRGFSSQVLRHQVYSHAFAAGGFDWWVLCYPNGNNDVKHLSLYLSTKPASVKFIGKASFRLTVRSSDPARTIKREALHMFSLKAPDWGWASFALLSDLRDPAKGFLLDDALTIEAEVQVHEGAVGTSAQRGPSGTPQKLVNISMQDVVAAIDNDVALSRMRADYLARDESSLGNMFAWERAAARYKSWNRGFDTLLADVDPDVSWGPGGREKATEFVSLAADRLLSSCVYQVGVESVELGHAKKAVAGLPAPLGEHAHLAGIEAGKQDSAYVPHFVHRDIVSIGKAAHGVSCTQRASVYLAAVMQYIAAEVLQSSAEQSVEARFSQSSAATRKAVSSATTKKHAKAASRNEPPFKKKKADAPPQCRGLMEDPNDNEDWTSKAAPEGLLGMFIADARESLAAKVKAVTALQRLLGLATEEGDETGRQAFRELVRPEEVLRLIIAEGGFGVLLDLLEVEKTDQMSTRKLVAAKEAAAEVMREMTWLTGEWGHKELIAVGGIATSIQYWDWHSKKAASPLRFGLKAFSFKMSGPVQMVISLGANGWAELNQMGRRDILLVMAAQMFGNTLLTSPAWLVAATSMIQLPLLLLGRISRVRKRFVLLPFGLIAGRAACQLFVELSVLQRAAAVFCTLFGVLAWETWWEEYSRRKKTRRIDEELSGLVLRENERERESAGEKNGKAARKAQRSREDEARKQKKAEAEAAARKKAERAERRAREEAEKTRRKAEEAARKRALEEEAASKKAAEIRAKEAAEQKTMAAATNKAGKPLMVASDLASQEKDKEFLHAHEAHNRADAIAREVLGEEEKRGGRRKGAGVQEYRAERGRRGQAQGDHGGRGSTSEEGAAGNGAQGEGQGRGTEDGGRGGKEKGGTAGEGRGEKKDERRGGEPTGRRGEAESRGGAYCRRGEAKGTRRGSA